MAGRHTRKKQPEVVRRALLDCGARLAVQRGLAALTVQAVADAAGVTKGGFLHHFPSKQALIEAIFSGLLEQLDAEIDARMAGDREARGGFTRAYVEALFAERHQTSPWAVLMMSSVTDPGLRRLWAQWLERRLERHRETDGDEMLEVVRLAADGMWLARMMGDDEHSMPLSSGLRARLMAMTRHAGPGGTALRKPATLNTHS